MYLVYAEVSVKFLLDDCPSELEIPSLHKQGECGLREKNLKTNSSQSNKSGRQSRRVSGARVPRGARKAEVQRNAVGIVI